MPLTELECAYIAGIVDGEGSIMLQRSHARSSGAYVYPVVKVANTDLALIQWLKNKVGDGSVNYQYRGSLVRKTVHHWGVASREATNLLTRIRPYLVIKQQQADVVLAVDAENQAALLLTGRKAFGRTNRVPMWLRHFRDACALYIRDLNRRGVDGPRFGPQIVALLAALNAEEVRCL